MRFDDRRLDELIVESEDLQSDAVRQARASVDDLADLAADRRRADVQVTPAEIAELNQSRRSLLRALGLGAGGLAAASALAPALIAVLAQPAAADQTLDVQMLQTASSLEKLAVLTYTAALTLPFIANGNPVIVKFAQTTAAQHNAHKMAFQAQTTALGGKVQDNPNPVLVPVVNQAKAGLTTPLSVVKLAAMLEQIARDTYLSDLSMFSDTKSKAVMGSVMGVETQHLATLHAVGALLSANDTSLIAIPTNVAQLPAAAGTASLDVPYPMATMQRAPAEGAVQ